MAKGHNKKWLKKTLIANINRARKTDIITALCTFQDGCHRCEIEDDCVDDMSLRNA